MPRRAQARLVTLHQKLFHAIGIRLQHAPVARLWPRRPRQPPDRVDGILHPDPPDRYPFRWSRQLGRIPPEKFLREMKTKIGQRTPTIHNDKGSLSAGRKSKRRQYRSRMTRLASAQPQKPLRTA